MFVLCSRAENITNGPRRQLGDRRADRLKRAQPECGSDKSETPTSRRTIPAASPFLSNNSRIPAASIARRIAIKLLGRGVCSPRSNAAIAATTHLHAWRVRLKTALTRRVIEGIVSKGADAPYTPGNRGLWRKVKCLNCAEFVVVGWTDPEGSRPYLGALLLAYYDPGGRLVYADRVGTGINTAELERLWRRLQPLATDKMPLDVAPPRTSRFGSPLVLSRVHWVRPELVARGQVWVMRCDHDRAG
jgi:ATP dependent DNA ligase C terminal region